MNKKEKKRKWKGGREEEEVVVAKKKTIFFIQFILISERNLMKCSIYLDDINSIFIRKCVINVVDDNDDITYSTYFTFFIK